MPCPQFCGLCCGDDKEDYDGGFRARDRYTTDFLFLIVFLVFLVGWAIIGAVSFKDGDPARLIYGTDNLGNLCGEENPRNVNYSLITNGTDGWAKMQYLWYPLAEWMDDIDTALNLAICVQECPTVDLNINLKDLTDFSVLNQVKSYRVNEKQQTYTVWYNSKPILHRCIPDQILQTATSVGKTFGDKLTALGNAISFGDLVDRGVAEMKASWIVIVIGFGLSVVISFVWLVLMRWLIKPLVWMTIILILLVLVGAGLVCYYQKIKLYDQYKETGLTEEKRWSAAYYTAAIIFWILSFIYLLLLIWMGRRIKIAIEILKMATKVVASTPTLITVPIVIVILIGVLFGFYIGMALCIQTVGSFEDIAVVINSTSVSAGDLAGYKGFDVSPVLNSTFFKRIQHREFYHGYNFFGMLWSMGILNVIGFFIVSFTCVFWYWSKPGDDKSTPPGIILKSAWYTLRYHLGTVCFGSLIVAIIQFMRYLLGKFQARIQEAAGSGVVGETIGRMVKFMMWCAQCILACLERVIKFVNKNAYIITCIRGTSFCSSVFYAFRIILGNLLRVAAVSFIGDFVMFLTKVLIVGTNVITVFVLAQYTILAKDAQYIFIPCLIVGLFTYAVASLFMNLLDACADTLLVAFLVDEEENKNLEICYMPTDLAEVVDRHAYVTPTGNKVAPETTDPVKSSSAPPPPPPAADRQPTPPSNPPPIVPSSD